MGITYSIAGGADAAKFNIDGSSGKLTFKTAPDFENPGDANGDNIYEVTVKATDAEGASSTQDIKVTVKDVSENLPPQITSVAAVSVNENQTDVLTVTATDPDDGGVTPPPVPDGAPVVETQTIAFGVPAEADQLVGTVKASNSPTAWEIVEGDSAFAIDASGKLTANPLGSNKYTKGWSDLVKAQNYSLSVKATNASGSGTGTITVNCSRLPWPTLDNRPVISGTTMTWTGPASGGPSLIDDKPQSATLTVSSATQTSAANQVIQNMDFTAGQYFIMHDNVTFRHCRFRGTLMVTKGVAYQGAAAGTGGTNAANKVVEDCDIITADGTTGGYGGVDITFRRCRFHGSENAITKWFYNCVIKDCIFDTPTGSSTAHLDQVECYSLATPNAFGGYLSNKLYLCNNTHQGPLVGGAGSPWCGAVNCKVQDVWSGNPGATNGPDIWIDSCQFIVPAGSTFYINDQGGQINCINSAWFPNGSNPRRNGSDGAQVVVNSGNFWQAKQGDFTGAPIKGNGKI